MVDQRLLVDIIYLVFQKAFDKVTPCHTEIVLKLKAHNIRGRALNWIDDWLTGRRQRVV